MGSGTTGGYSNPDRCIMTVTIDGTTGISAPGVTDTGNLSVTGTSTLTGAVSQTGSSTAASFIPSGSTVPTNGVFLPSANTVAIATNSTNQVSISSTGIVTGTAGNLMLVQGTSQASTSGTSITFSSIPSWVKRITVSFHGVSTNGTSNYLIQIGSGSVTSTGYQSTSVGLPGGGTQSSTAGLIISSANNANISYGQMVLTLVTNNTWAASHTFGDYLSTFYVILGGGGSPNLSGALDRVVITTVNGTDTFDAGTINIQYE